MAKRFDYYAGYPGQQRTPKWVGVTLGSLFGGMTIISLALGIRLVIPPRTAEASTAQKPAVVAAAEAPALTVPAAAAAPMTVHSASSDEDGAAVMKGSRHGKHGGKHAKLSKKSKGGHSIALASNAPSSTPKYKRAQMFAKSVSGGRRDKRARDDLDKMLGL